MEKDFKVYGYRWVVLLVYVIINALMQIQWIAFAPITSEALAFYNVPAVLNIMQKQIAQFESFTTKSELLKDNANYNEFKNANKKVIANLDYNYKC
jgi:hypothetical protein